MTSVKLSSTNNMHLHVKCVMHAHLPGHVEKRYMYVHCSKLKFMLE